MNAAGNSLTEENYLKAIYRLAQAEAGKISLTAIAETVGVNSASAIDMVKKLKDKKFISYDKSKGAKLTDKGYKVAVAIVRNHRLWEVFLLDKLGYSWDVVHEIAEQMEHVKHPELSERLDKFLDYPHYDPHGDPIPKPNGELPNTSKTVLSEIDEGKICRVVAVKNTSSVFLQYLQQLSISIGSKIKMIEKIPFDGSVIIQVEKKDKTTVSMKLAESLFVE